MSEVPSRREPSHLRNALVLLAFLAVIYVLGFLTILLDEAVLRTFFFSRHLPDGFRDVVRTMYEPLLRLLFSL